MLKDPWQRLLLLMVLVFAVNGLFLLIFPPTEQDPVARIAYSRFKNELSRERIAEVTLQGEGLSGIFWEPLSLSSEEIIAAQFEGIRPYKRFRTNIPPFGDPGLIAFLEEHEVVINVEPPEKTAVWVNLLASLLPWIIIFGVWWYIFL